MERRIPLYSYDGGVVQWIDTRRLNQLTRCGRISRVVKSRKGYVMRATLHRMPGEPKPSFLRDYLGTKYAFRQSLPDGHRCFRLRSLGDNPNDDERNLAPDDVRPIFMRVLLECLAPAV